jgi:hypothetical protein
VAQKKSENLAISVHVESALPKTLQELDNIMDRVHELTETLGTAPENVIVHVGTLNQNIELDWLV